MEGPILTDGDCSHEIKRHLFLGRKAMTNLDSILKNRDTVLLTKVCIVKAMVFPVVMCGCESWTIKKTELRWSFELWCWRKLFRVPWTTRRSNQSILRKSTLNIHWKDLCWSWSSNTLATWCEDPWLIGKDSYAGKDWGQEEKGMTEDKSGWHHQLNEHEFEQTPGDSEGQSSPACCSSQGPKELDIT